MIEDLIDLVGVRRYFKIKNVHKFKEIYKKIKGEIRVTKKNTMTNVEGIKKYDTFYKKDKTIRRDISLHYQQ